MERIRCRLGFKNMLVVDCVGKSGGLALLWGDEVGVEIQNYRRRHINAKISPTSATVPWKLTGFYGHPEAGKWGEAWELLRFLSSMEPTPWVCLGDFNEILNLSEKWGGNGRQRCLMEAFQSTLEECELLDLGFRGPKFTWNNRREGDAFIKERLNRVVANVGWCTIFPTADFCVEEAMSSDHCPIFVTLNDEKRGRRNPPRFRHEARWMMEGSYSEVIKKVWIAKVT